MVNLAPVGGHSQFQISVWYLHQHYSPACECCQLDSTPCQLSHCTSVSALQHTLQATVHIVLSTRHVYSVAHILPYGICLGCQNGMIVILLEQLHGTSGSSACFEVIGVLQLNEFTCSLSEHTGILIKCLICNLLS